MHHKIVVADRKKAIVGGINIADKYYGPKNTEPWLDFAILINGDICAKLEKICYLIEEKKYKVIIEENKVLFNRWVYNLPFAFFYEKDEIVFISGFVDWSWQCIYHCKANNLHRCFRNT